MTEKQDIVDRLKAMIRVCQFDEELMADAIAEIEFLRSVSGSVSRGPDAATLKAAQTAVDRIDKRDAYGVDPTWPTQLAKDSAAIRD